MNTRSSSPSEKIGVMEYVVLLRQNLRLVMAVIVVAVVITGVASMMMPSLYKSSTLIIPVMSSSGKNSSMNSAMGLIGSSGGGGSLSSLLGAASGQAGGVDYLEVIAKSRTVGEHVITQLNLLPILFPDQWDGARQAWKNPEPEKQPTPSAGVGRLLKQYVKFNINKRQRTISIEAYFPDRDMAARVANGYADALRWYINEKAWTTSKRNRIYIGKQLEKTRKKLLEAGKENKAIYKNGNISTEESDIDVPLKDLVEDSDIEKKDVYASLDADAGPLQESDTSTVDEIISDVPQQTFFSYVAMQNQILGRINALLATQYMLAKIEENKEDLGFEVVDPAIPSRGRYSPKPLFMITAAAFLAFCGAMFFLMMREYVRREKTAVA